MPSHETNGFPPAACILDGALYVSVANGALYRLNVDQQKWEESGRTTPRIAHRMVSDGGNILVLGGASNGHNFDLIELASCD